MSSKNITANYIMDRMGSDATDAEVSAMIRILRDRGVTTEAGFEAISDAVWSGLIADAVAAAS